MQTDHNLCLNLCFDQSLTFAIQGTKVESPPKCYKRLKFLDSYSDKKALQSTKVMFQIGTIIPMVLTNAFQLTNLFLVFVITLFPAVISM